MAEEKNMSPRTVEMLDNIVKMQERLEELEQDNSVLRSQYNNDQREINFLKKQLAICESKRDMFQRHSVALYTRIADLLPTMHGFVGTISRALKDARDEALTPPQTKPEQELDGALKSIVEEMNDDGRGTAADAKDPEIEGGAEENRVQGRRRLTLRPNKDSEGN